MISQSKLIYKNYNRLISESLNLSETDFNGMLFYIQKSHM